MKRIITLILSLAMVMCFMPTVAFAEDSPISLIGATITLDKASYEYGGTQIKPGVTSVVVANKAVVAASKDVPLNQLDITYGDNINAGDSSGTVIVKPKSGSAYSDSATVKFKIDPRPLSNATLQNLPNVVEGATITAADIILKDLNKVLTARDYTVPANLKAVAGTTVSVNVTGAGNYTGTRIVNVYGGKSIAACTVTATGPSNLTYDGQEKKFSSVTVTDDSTTLIKDTDYTLSYTNNVNAGQATMKVVGIGNYAGNVSKTFTIESKSIAGVTIAPIENQKPNGTPILDVKDGSIYGSLPLILNTDYTVEYKNNGSVGNTASVTLTGRENYTGSTTRYYSIKKDIALTYVYYQKTDYDYTGSVITPEIILRDGATSSILTLNRDYKLVYTTPTSNINAGTVLFKVVGIDEYGGESKGYVFTIKPRNLSTDLTTRVTLYPDKVYFDGKEQKPIVSIVSGGRTLINNTDYTVTYYNNTQIGIATISIFGRGNYAGYFNKTFPVLGKEISTASASLSQTAYTYDGYAKQPTVTVYDGGRRLTNNIDYTVTYANNLKAGTASAIITGKGSYSGTKTLFFDIKGNKQKITTNSTYYTRYLTSDPFNLGARTNGDGIGFTYRSSDEKVIKVSSAGAVTVTGTGSAMIIVSTYGDTKYTPATKTVYITVKPLKPIVKLSSLTSRSMKVQIRKVEGATKYQINYGRNGSYRNYYFTHSNADYTTQSKTFKNLRKGKTYAVKVRSYKTMDDGTKVWGNWTTTKRIVIK